MLIRNVKSFSDLQKKRDLQANLLQIAIENEEVLENRVKDYKNPNKPPPVPPQYKSTAELQKDTNLQQREVINNLLSITGVDATIALGVSQGLSQLPNGVGNFLIFNKNFPVIKKRLEDISKAAYGVDTFMNKIQEVLEQVEIGTLYNTTGGINAQKAFNQGIGAGNILASAETYNTLVAKLVFIRDLPQSPLPNDPDFIAIFNIYEGLLLNSPSIQDLAEIDTIEQLERQKIQKEIDRLINIRGVPTALAVGVIENNINPREYEAELDQAIQFQAPLVPETFTKPFADLVRLAKNIKDPNLTITDIGRLRDRIVKNLEGGRAVQKGLTTQLVGTQQTAIRKRQIEEANVSFETTLRSGNRINQRLIMNQPNPYTKQVYGNNMVAYSATIDGNIPDPVNNLANIIVEAIVRVMSKQDAQLLPFRLSGKIEYGIMNGDGDEIKKADGSSYNDIDEFKQDYPNLDRFFYRNVMIIREPPKAEQDAYKKYEKELKAYPKAEQAYQKAGQAYQRQQSRMLGMSKKELAKYTKTNPILQNPKQPQPPLPVAQPQKDMRLVIGSDASLLEGLVPQRLLIRLSPAEMEARSQVEIDALRQVLATDPQYDPAANEDQRLIPQQGYGLKKGYHSGKGLSFREFMFGSQGQGFKDVMKERSDATNRAITEPFVNTGNKIKGFFGGGRMCPQNYEPVMAKDGKMYGNSCKAQAGGGADPNYKVDGLGFMNRKIKIGKGIAVEEQPRYKTFGKYIIHMPYLENDNVLNVKFQSMGSIPSIKPVSIDDNFKDFVLDIMNTGCVNQKHYNSLTEPEKTYFHKIVKGAGLSNTLKFKADDKIDDKKDVKRLDILVGQIVAGNDNDKVFKEAKELIRKCVENGSITRHRGMDLLFQIE